MNLKSRSTIYVCLAIVLLLAAAPASAQIKSSTITGTVTDPSGAATPEAIVTITNQQTNVSQEGKTGATGEYQFPYLQAGTYSVDAKKAGFSIVRKTGIVLGTAQSVRVDLALEVGRTTETVVVKAESVQLQTDSSVVEGAVSSTLIEAIPNITQNPMYYATLQAGVLPKDAMQDTNGPNSVGIGYDARRRFSAFSMNGNNAFLNDIQLDGVTVQGSAWNEATVLPNSDGIQEVRVIANSFSAEYGRGGGIISMISKSGTNQFHGSVYERERNEALNANSFSNNVQNISRGVFRLHDYGGTLGGPVIIPKVFNGKDKLFFFTSFERMTHSDPAVWLLSVPTAAERKGDFSQTFTRDANGNLAHVQLYDPDSAVQVQSGLYRRPLVPGGIYANPNPYALAIYGSYPLPNRTPDDATGLNNYLTQKQRAYVRDSSNNRADFRTGKHYFYFTGGLGSGSISTPRPYGADSPFYLPPTNGGGAMNTQDYNPYGSFGDTIVLSPTLVVDVRYGVNRVNSKYTSNENTNFDYAKYGVPKDIQSLFALPGSTPEILFKYGDNQGYSDLNFALYQNKTEHQTNHDLAGSVTKSAGRWSFKLGSEFRNYLSNYQDFMEGSAMSGWGWGQNGFNAATAEYVDAQGNEAWGAMPNPLQVGSERAQYFAGGFSWEVDPAYSLRPAFSQKYLAFYSQNDWRATDKLTINLGLRWDLQPGPTERYNRMSSLDLSATNPFGGKGQHSYAGTSGYSRNMYNTDWKDLGPRLGAAYRLSENAVIRAGYGITYVPSNTGYYDGPYLYGMANFASNLVMKPYGTSPNGVPVGHFWDSNTHVIVGPVGTDLTDPVQYGANNTNFSRLGFLNGRVQQWNVFLEKRLGSWFFSAGYTGSKGTHLQNQGWNAFNSEAFLPSATLANLRQQWLASNGNVNPLTVQVTNPYQTKSSLIGFLNDLGNSTITQQQALSAYPMWGTGSIANVTNGFSRYDSMQLHAEHHFANGFELQTSYTWSKARDFQTNELQGGQGFNDGGWLGGNDIYNLHNNVKYSTQDTPHRLVVFGLYELPFGQGKKLDVGNRIGRFLLGGWQIGAVYVIQSGTPMGVSGLTDGSINGSNDRLAGVSAEVPKALQHWYDGKTSVTLPNGHTITPCNHCFLKYYSGAFSGRVATMPDGSIKADDFWWGAAAPNYGDLRNPGRNNLDASLIRNFRIKEKLDVQFLAQFTNALNHAQFQGMTGGLGSTASYTDASTGLKPGMATSADYGTHGLTTYSPREGILSLRLQF